MVGWLPGQIVVGQWARTYDQYLYHSSIRIVPLLLAIFLKAASLIPPLIISLLLALFL
jgi:hypothetical protein